MGGDGEGEGNLVGEGGARYIGWGVDGWRAR